MNTPIEYIENYFSGNLTNEDKEAFEKRCESDYEFAEEVGFYIITRDTLQKRLIEEKKQEFAELYKKTATKGNTQHYIGRYVPYISAAAATLLIFFSWIFFFNNPSPEKIASSFIKDELATLSVTMGSSEDKLQEGISAYNKQKYSESEKIFTSLKRDNKYKIEAIKYLGLTYLIQGKYNQAIEQFELLSAIPNLYANSGPFYKAVSLMKRGEEEDKDQIKKLLEDVIREDLPGRKKAEVWIEELY